MSNKVTRIECPGCSQPIEILVPVRASVIWPVSVAVLGTISLCLAVYILYWSRSAPGHVEVRPTTQLGSPQTAPVTTDQLAAVRLTAITATRAAILEEFESRINEREMTALKQSLGTLQRNARGLQGPTDDQIQRQSWEELAVSFRRSLGCSIDGPVRLEGTVGEHWPEGSTVESSDGYTNTVWPVKSGPQLRQLGLFVVRGAEISPSTHIDGLGSKPQPVIFTNRFGKVRLIWSYEMRR